MGATLMVVLPGAVPAQVVADRWARSGEAFIRQLDGGAYGAAAARVSPAVPAGVFTAEKLEQIWSKLKEQVGELKALAPAKVTVAQGHHVVDLTAEFERSALRIRVVLDDAEQVGGLWFLPPEPPAYEPPAYVDTTKFEERDVEVGEAPWQLPGVLTVPKGVARAPGVVLVHGSGPNDRDETLGPNRPFRDLAWGLASQGIAVLRYDKRTRVHGAKMDLKKVTVDEETVDDAVAAASLLGKQAGVDPGRVYVLGHSLGAVLAPVIAARAGDALAGVVMLAGTARPLATVLEDQLSYLATLQSKDDTAALQQLQALRDSAAMLRDHKLADDAEVMGAPASYFYDLDRRDPVGVAKGLKLRMLILQGGRDYQATMEDFGIWQGALGGRPNVTLKAYPNLSHLFTEGEGKATPAEYMNEGKHVAAAVVHDIAAWVKR